MVFYFQEFIHSLNNAISKAHGMVSKYITVVKNFSRTPINGIFFLTLFLILFPYVVFGANPAKIVSSDNHSIEPEENELKIQKKAFFENPTIEGFLKLIELYSEKKGTDNNGLLRYFKIGFSTNPITIALPSTWALEVSPKNHIHIFKKGREGALKIILFYNSLNCPSKICMEKVFSNSCKNFEKKFSITKKGWESLGAKKVLSATLKPKKKKDLYIKFFTVSDRDYTHNCLFVSQKAKITRESLALLEDILLRASGQIPPKKDMGQNIDDSPLRVQVIKEEISGQFFK